MFKPVRRLVFLCPLQQPIFPILPLIVVPLVNKVVASLVLFRLVWTMMAATRIKHFVDNVYSAISRWHIRDSDALMINE